MEMYKGNIYQIRNRIECGLGSRFSRNGYTYALTPSGRLRNCFNNVLDRIEVFDLDNWALLK